jgi:integrase
MSKKFNKLTREAMKALKPGEYICENNIKYTKLDNGDGLFSVYGNANGKRFHRNVGKDSQGITRLQAEEVFQKLMQDAKADRFNLPKGRKYEQSFQEMAKRYLERLQQTDGKNVDRKEQQLNAKLIPFFKGQPLSKIATFDVERFKRAMLDQGNKPATVNRWLCTLSHLINKALEWGWIEHKPCVIKKLKEDNARITYLTPDEIHRVLEEAKKDPYPIIYPFIKIALGTSMRLREILSIRLEEIDFERCIIYIPKAKSGAREQPMTKQLAEYLKEYMKMVSQDQPWLFPSNKSNSGHYETIERPWRRVLEAAGLDGYEIVRHTLRHTAITHLVQAGVDLPTVMRISGHKSLQMVQRYSHQNGEHIQSAMEKLENRYQAAT